MTRNAPQPPASPRSGRFAALRWPIVAAVLLYAALLVPGHGWRSELRSRARGDRTILGVRSVDLDSTVVVAFKPPDVQVARDGVVLSARLWNEGSQHAHTTVSSELLRDGQTIETTVTSLDVPAQTVFTFAQRFSVSGTRHETYTVRTKFKPYPPPRDTKLRQSQQ